MLAGGYDKNIADQVAYLLNEHNNLQTLYDSWKINSSQAVYYPAVTSGVVLGSIAISRDSFLLSEIKHVVVHPAARSLGLGKALVHRALTVVQTPVSYCTVREDNHASLALFRSSGFRIAAKACVDKHRVFLLIREHGQNKAASSGV